MTRSAANAHPLRGPAAMLVAAAMAAACGSPAPKAEPAAAAVDAPVARVDLATLPAWFEGGGVLRARLTAVVSSRLLAPVTEVRVRPGDRVRRGQTLIVLDARELDAQAARAAAAHAAARETAAAAGADEQAAVAARVLARATHGRIAGLEAKRSATAQELDEAVAALAAADARVSSAHAHAAEAAAALTAASAAADAARIASSYAVIAAPFDGVVTERRIDPGTTAAPGTPLLTVEDTTAFQLAVPLDEARAAQVRLGQSADVRLDAVDAAADGWVSGRVVEIARVDPAAHSFVAKIDVPATPALRSGLFGRARFAGASRRVLAAPRSAVVRRGQLAFVFVAADGIARLRPVTVGEGDGDRVEILAGLSPGEFVVVAPPASLVDGARLAGAAGRSAAAAAGAGARP